jgi:hypothetical protein
MWMIGLLPLFFFMNFELGILFFDKKTRIFESYIYMME